MPKTPRMLKQAVQQGRSRARTGGVAFSPARPELLTQLYPDGVR